MLGSFIVVFLALLLFLPLVIGAPVLASSNNCHYYFIIYGQDWCPHCQNMERFVIENYGAQCLEFRDLDVPRWNKNFTLIVEELNKKYSVPTQAAFPLTGVLVDGKLRGIIQGEVTSKQAINYVIERADKEGSQWIAVYTNGLYVIKPDATILHGYKPEHPSNSLGIGISTTTMGGERSSNKMLITAGVLIIIVGVIAAALLLRR